MGSEVSKTKPVLSVIVVTICGVAYLTRCLNALKNQANTSNVELIVVYDERHQEISLIEYEFPDAKLVKIHGMKTPEELASHGIRNAGGSIVGLIEDHCIADKNWCSRILEFHDGQHAAVGGAVECISPTVLNWAFAYCDYYRYLNPVPEKITRYLTVCNVSYQRAALEKIAKIWKNYFHETYVNEAIRRNGETLWLSPDLVVYQERNIQFVPAVRERYSFGRLYGSRRVAAISPVSRFFYVLASPTIPFLLMGRMLKNILLRKRCFLLFVKSMPLLTIFTMAWSWGEFLGYLTGREPEEVFVARI